MTTAVYDGFASIGLTWKVFSRQDRTPVSSGGEKTRVSASLAALLPQLRRPVTSPSPTAVVRTQPSALLWRVPPHSAKRRQRRSSLGITWTNLMVEKRMAKMLFPESTQFDCSVPLLSAANQRHRRMDHIHSARFNHHPRVRNSIHIRYVLTPYPLLKKNQKFMKSNYLSLPG